MTAPDAAARATVDLPDPVDEPSARVWADRIKRSVLGHPAPHLDPSAAVVEAFLRGTAVGPVLVMPFSTTSLEESVETIRLRLAGWANQLAARFGAPVYLVGSTLTTTNPRDIDVRVVLDDDAFEARYGVSAALWARDMWGTWSAGSLRWGADMAKLNAQAVKAFAWNLDVQVHPEIAAERHAERPRLRLDALRQGPDFAIVDEPPPGWPRR